MVSWEVGWYGACWMEGVDELTYEVKRAHWGGNSTAMRRFRLEAISRKELKKMTPVRFDVLFLILQRAQMQGVTRVGDMAISLGEIIVKLGFRKSTIARSVRIMEEIGFVRRERDHVDRRQTIVIMMKRGFDALRAALELVRRDPNFLVERIRHWLGMIGANRENHSEYAAKIRQLARLFDQWSYPIYTARFDPMSVYPMRWKDPPTFMRGVLLRASPSRSGDGQWPAGAAPGS